MPRKILYKTFSLTFKSILGIAKTNLLSRAMAGTTKGFSHFILIQIKSPPWCWLEYYHVVTYDLLNLLSTLGASPTSTPILGTTNPYKKTHLCHSTSVGHR